MATEMLNKAAYDIVADNLVLGAQYPVLHRTVTVTNPAVAIERGMAVINHSGTLYIAGAKDDDETVTGDIVAIISSDHAADATSETLNVDSYVSGAFNTGSVKTIEDLDIDTDAYILGAQSNGIYLL